MNLNIFLFKVQIFKAKTVVAALFTKKGIIIFPIMISLPFVLTNEVKGIGSLIILMVFDFITGIGASYFLLKKYEKENPDEEKKDLISSEKLKGSGVKFLLYSMTILSAYNLNNTFQLKSFSLPISDIQFNLTLLIIGFWCLVECYSIVFENFRDMGIDVKKIIKKIINLRKIIEEKTKEVCDKT